MGAAACGTVLGLGDYGDAPRDAGTSADLDAERGETGDAGQDVTGSAAQDAADGVERDAADSAARDAADGDRRDAADSAQDDAPVDAATQLDAPSVDAGTCTDGGTSCFVVPGGWTVVAFANSSQITCPAGFSTNAANLVFGAAQPAANACACDACSVTAPPTCVQGQLTGSGDFDGSRTCSGFPITLGNSSPGGCNTDNTHARIPNLDLQLLGPGPTGGTCSATPTAHADRVSFPQQGRICSPDGDAGVGCSDGGPCAPSIAAPFLPCLSQAGNVACPPGPFGVSYHAGSGATLSCGGTCTCALNATCTSKTVTYYTDSMCQSLTTLAITANGTCQSGGAGIGGGTIYGSYKYTAAANATCSFAGSPSTSAVGLANEQTVCCAQ